MTKVNITLDFDPNLYFPVEEREPGDEIVDAEREILSLIRNIGDLDEMGITNIKVTVADE